MDVAGHSALQPLLDARSVAVVGASPRPGAVGRLAMDQLLGGGFTGAVHPVNPRHDDVCGLPCAPTLEDIGATVDLVVLAVGARRLEAQLESAAETGVRAAVVFASAHEHDAGVTPLPSRLAAIARTAGMALCGPNSMGFVHLDVGLRATGYDQPLDLAPGPVALLTHSGSLFTSMLHNRRGVRFNLAVSTGQELVTTMADYLRYAVARATTRVVALFCETVRDPDGFVAALAEARRRDVAVVALTVGRHAESRALVTAHSGALAGADGAYEAVFDAYGVHRVRTIDELLDTAAVLAMDRAAAPGGLAVMHDSGGERAHVLDLALDGGVPLAELAPRTRAALAAVLDPGLPATNPLDVWGSSVGFHDVFMACGTALLRDPDTAVLAFCVDLPDRDDDSYPRIARELHAGTDKPVVVLANVAGAVNPVVADQLRSDGIVVLEGTATGLAALSHLLARRDRRSPAPETVPAVGDPEVRERWRSRLRDRAVWDEADALALLAEHGVPVVAHRRADTADDAVRAAADLGYPVAVKTAAPGIGHKTDLGGVHLGLGDAAAVRAAYDQVAARLGRDVTVAAMTPPGVELALGVTVDPAFGPLLVVGAGGVLVEIIEDRRVALPPVGPARARRLLDDLVLAPVLRGVRGGPAVDLAGVAATIAALSQVAVDLGDLLTAVDINPLVCRADGCVAVDALVVPAVADAAEVGER